MLKPVPGMCQYLGVQLEEPLKLFACVAFIVFYDGA